MKKKKKSRNQYDAYVRACNVDGIEPMSIQKWQNLQKKAKNHVKDNFLSKKPTKRTLWSKIDRDPVFAAAINSRIEKDEFGNIMSGENLTMSNRPYADKRK